MSRDELVIFLVRFDFELRRGFLDRAERFHHEHGMMRDDRAPAFADDGRMRHAFGIADVHDVPDDVVGVFLERIIGRAIEIAARAIVIDAESAADIEITELVSELGQLRVIARRFAHGAFDRARCRAPASRHGNEPASDNARGPRAFNISLAATRLVVSRPNFAFSPPLVRPFAGAFAVQTHANSDVRFDADFLCGANGLLELLEFLDDDDDRLAELAAHAARCG